MPTKTPKKKTKKKRRSSTRTRKLTTPLKWHGGKNYLAPAIVDLMPPHLHYVEPYFGGGAVLFARDATRNWYEGADDWTGAAAQRGSSEVVNDIHGELTNFWRMIQRDVTFQKFLRAMQATPFSEIEWQDAMDYELKTGLTRAKKFFVRCRQSLSGRMDCFASRSRSRTRGGINEQVNAWLGAVEGLPAVHERLKRVLILNDDALNVIRKEDSPKTLFYLDPPYLHETRASKDVYEFEMTEGEHRQLLEQIQNVKGKVMLSGHHSLLYDDMLADWKLKEFDKANSASGAKEKRRMMECVWTNF